MPILSSIFTMPLFYGAIATTIVVLLFVIELVIFKKFAFIQLITYGLIVLLSIILPTDKLFVKIILDVFVYLLAGYSIYDFINSYLLFRTYDQELNNFLKNNEFDFFIQTNNKDKIQNFTNKLLKITKLTAREIKGMHCWKLLLNYMKVKRINKKNVEMNSISDFLASYKEANSKKIIYQFTFEMPKFDDLLNGEETSLVNYIGLIQPIYFKDKLIGRNIYFYQDRMQVLKDLRNALSQAVSDLTNAQNFIHIMMSLTDYVGLYFDYNSRMYIPTESFVKFTNSHQREYTFDQFMELMHPDDIDHYVEEASTINSISVTRLKYRLLINDEYYYVLEDSIYINKDSDLVSIIHILNKTDEVLTREVPLSNNEIEAALDSLNATDILSVVKKTENILNTVIGENDEEN